MERLLTTALVLLLLGGSAVAVGVIEGFKLEKNPISGPRVDDFFSPVCRCEHRVAHISLRLRTKGQLSLDVIDSDNRVVRRLVRGRSFDHNRLYFTWNGRADSGQRVPDGLYKFRLHFRGLHRTIVLPKGTTVDTKPPAVAMLAVQPRVFSPDGDHLRDRLGVRYRVTEHARVRLLVDGRVEVRGRFARLTDTIRWPGTARGRPLPAGVYRVSLVAQDLAGNLGRTRRSVPVRIRYVAFAAKVVRARLGTRLLVRVLTDASVVHWQFLGRTGTSRPRRLVLRPTKLGRHALVVEANGHFARALVIVVKR